MKVTKDTVPEGFSIQMALVDLLPVLFYGIANILLGYILRDPLFITGGAICTISGTIKVIWKMIVAVKHRNVWPMFLQMRIFMPLGFVLIIISIIMNRGAFAEFFGNIINYPVCLGLLIAWVIGMIAMTVCAIKLDNADVKSNWIEQSINAVAQLMLLICVIVIMTTGAMKADEVVEIQEPQQEETTTIVDDSKADDAKADDAEPETIVNPVEEYQAWTTDRVNFRKLPSADAEVISKINAREEVTVTGETNEWLQVRYSNQLGFVSREYISTEEPQAAFGQAQPLVVDRSKTTGRIVCIDAGHQRYGSSATEPNGPGSGTMKARVTGGTTGRTTGVPEYQLTLDIALKLQAELEARGYTVVMTRTTHDVDISNMERATVANNAGADITIRIHANGSENTGISGALTMAPSESNPYCAYIANESQYLSRCVIDQYCAATGMANQGVSITDTMTGINWCQMPVTIIEMGYMTNPSDDVNMQDPNYQNNMVIGIANGIDAFFTS